MDDIQSNQKPATETTVDTVKLPVDKPQKTASDWVRDMRMSASVNKTTTGVETDKVTAELLLATSNKLLNILKNNQAADPKDSLEFQRFYGPAEYFAEHILRDGGKLGRNLLWKATNRGTLDFIQPAALDAHVSDVFYDSKLAQMVDGSSPLETVDSAYKTTRVGEGGVTDITAAPDEMRTVQSSYFGFLDPVRCFPEGMEVYTKTGWIPVKDMTMDTEFACLVDGTIKWQLPEAIHTYDYNGPIYSYSDDTISFSVTPNHNMFTCNLATVSGGAAILKKCSFVAAERVFSGGIWKVFTGTGEQTTDTCGDITKLDALLAELPDTLPEWVFDLSYADKTYLLNGVFNGDRHTEYKTQHKQLADDLQRLLFETGKSVIVYEDDGAYTVSYSSHIGHIICADLKFSRYAGKSTASVYSGKIYCPTVNGNVIYTRHAGYNKNGEPFRGIFIGQSPESKRVGLDMYMTKHCMKGSDGKLYQRFINAKTGKEELVDSVTAAKSVVACPEMMDAQTSSIFALGGDTGVRIVPKASVDYYLPRADDAYSFSSNLVTMPSAVKEMRLLMGCLSPHTSIITVSNKNEVRIQEAKKVQAPNTRIPGSSDNGESVCYNLRNTISKFPKQKKWFKKVVLRSGRTLITSYDHRWPILVDGGLKLVDAKDIKPGDKVLRSTFKDIPNRRTFINGTYINKDIAFLIGVLCRGVCEISSGKLKVEIDRAYEATIQRAIDKLELQNTNIYEYRHKPYLGIQDDLFISWIIDSVGLTDDDRAIPSEILSAHADTIMAFIDGYTADKTKVGIDSNEDTWILEIPNMIVRDALSFLFARLNTDTLYRDNVADSVTSIAIKLVPQDTAFGDMIVDTVKAVVEAPPAQYMVDIDINDNMYATANGVITHNSKYPLQAVSITGRETPLVRGLDEASGKDMSTLAGKYLGAIFADKSGVVSAVRKDRIDVIYDDGTKAALPMYRNFPMNAKGYIDNTPVVKAGQAFKKGSLLASSNYTDDKGVAAIGLNLRSGWLSWKGGTYEDAVVVSESAAKKMTSTTMYKTSVDLDKTIKLGKTNYATWKPAEYTKEQLEQLDEGGVIKPGSIIKKGDPMILAVQTAEPSPGTMGKRILTDLSETWEHDHPGVVTDVVKTRTGVKVFATVEAPAEIGDKISGLYGNKGSIAQIIPDDQMPRNKKGEPLELLWSPLGLISRTNKAQVYEALLGKVAKKTGTPEIMPAFYSGDLYKYTEDKLKQHRVKADEDLIDPETGRTIPNVMTGFSYVHKLKHMAGSKISARGTDEYSSEALPGGSGFTGSKRFGGLEQSAMVGHAAFDVIQDSKLLRGQSNADFWRSIRTGQIPTIPGEPLVHKKFFAHLTGSGVNIRHNKQGISCFALSSDDIDELAGAREVRSRDTYENKTFRPIDGGLFGQDIFGINGDRWAYIQLDEPVPNPVMEAPLARLLRLSDKDFIAVASGSKEVDGMKSAADMKNRLASINLTKEAANALQEFKNSPMSKKDAALKRYTAIERMRRLGVSPDKYMLDKIPVLPPIYRPVNTHNGLTMVADSNYLYAQLLDARDDLREARNLPAEYKQQAKERLYTRWKELTGLYEPEDPKLKNKHVQGLLKWALGDSPKWSAFQRKILGATVDTVGRGVVVPNPRLKLNQVGLPKTMAFGIMAPFVERALVKRGYTPIEAMKQVKNQTKQATDILIETMKERPVLMNRAPSLHKLNIMAFEPVLTSGNAIHVNPSIVVPFGMDFDGDQVNLHVPVSDNARKQARERMFPERNLIAMKNRQILYKPEKEYQQGLYIATRMKQAADVRPRIFRTLDEAKQAQREGVIDVDDPIIIQS